MFHKIIVCSDGSECAFEAARVGALLARHFGSEALALQVCDASIPAAVPMDPASSLFTPNMSDPSFSNQAQCHRDLMLPLFDAAGVSCRVLQLEGHPTDTIVRIAKQENADLIVLGSRGLNGIQKFFLGSVSNEVLHHAPCSVLIVRGDNVTSAAGGFQHILLVSDGSNEADKAARAAVEVAQKFATSLTVLNVAEPYATPPLTDGERGIRWTRPGSEAAASRLQKAVKGSVKQAAMEAGVYCSFHQEKGPADEIIVRFAEQKRSDLIVMGSRGLGRFGRLLLGSVSHHVARHATCPVLVVR